MIYGERWKSFQIQDPTYIDGHKSDGGVYDVCKYEHYTKKQTIVRINYKNGKPKVERVNVTPEDEYCFVIATIKYNPSEVTYNFESCGTRFLEYYENGLCEWIMDFLNERISFDEEKFEDGNEDN